MDASMLFLNYWLFTWMPNRISWKSKRLFWENLLNLKFLVQGFLGLYDDEDSINLDFWIYNIIYSICTVKLIIH